MSRDIEFKRVEVNNKKDNGDNKVKIFFLYIIIAILLVSIIYILVKNKFENRSELKGPIQQVELLGNSAENGYNAILMNLKIIRKQLDNGYKGEIDENKLMQSTIKGYVAGLGDEYTEYYTPDEWQEIREGLEGHFFGIGIYMTENKKGYTVIASVIKGTPAEKAGLKAGDIIYKVDDEDMTGLTSGQIAKRIKGKENTKVKIIVVRNKKELEFNVVREDIDIPVVHAKLLKDNIGYILIESFDGKVAEEFINAYKKLEKEGMKKLIIDVRNNFGGDVNQTVKLISFFLPKNDIIYSTEDYKGQKNTIKDLTDEKQDIKMVILGNKYSASASELLIAALIDNGKATFIGEKTYGKGVIQTVKPTTTGGALKFTTEEYFRPNKEKIHKQGVKPNIEVKIDETKKDKKGNVRDLQLEKALEEIKK